jgi:hypothetical protein
VRYDLALIVDSDLPPRQILSEIVSSFEFADELGTTVIEGVVLLDGEEAAVYPEERKE